MNIVGVSCKPMVIILSITLIALLTTYVIFVTYRNKSYFNSMVGMMISMTNSMMASVSLGTIFGIVLNDKDLSISTILSITIGVFIGLITGVPLSFIAILDGILAGVMGGMMGAMLGIMLQEAYSTLMISFIDLLFVIVIGILLRFINQEIQLNKQENHLRKY
jgi:hypothetical protein